MLQAAARAPRWARAVAFVVLVGVVVATCAALGTAYVALAGPCDWEWGGVVEDTPAPCDTPVPVATPTGTIPVSVPDPLPVSEVSPVVVPETFSGTATVDESGYFANAVYLGLGLVVLLLSLHVVRSMAKRNG